jgi:hypothetical protein
MISWEICREDFKRDGSLRDIYITPATLTEWRAIYPLLCDFAEVEFSVDGVIQPTTPAMVEQAFAVRCSASPLLSFRVSRTLISFHFFSEDEIECDVSPHEMTSQMDLDALLGFIRQLGDATSKRVIITPENCREHPFISYRPQSGVFEYHRMTD